MNDQVCLIPEEKPSLLSLPLEAILVLLVVLLIRRWVVVECSFDNAQGYTYDQGATEEKYDSHNDDANLEASLLASTLHGRCV
jgi:hypothetical protein